MQPKKILVTYDYSEVADKGLKYAIELQPTLGYKVVVAHVSNKTTDSELKTHLSLKGIDDVEMVILSNHLNTSVDEALAEYSKKEGISLIISGTNEINELELSKDSTTSANLVALTDCPVLSIKGGSTKQLKNITFCAEFIEGEDYKDFQCISNLALYFNAKIHFVYVKNNQNQYQVKKRINSFAIKWKIRNFETHILEDTSLINGVFHMSKKVQTDLLILGYHKDRLSEHENYGAISQDFINHTKYSVLTIHL